VPSRNLASMALELARWVEKAPPRDLQGTSARNLACLREIMAKLLPDEVTTTTWRRASGGPRVRVMRLCEAIQVDAARVIQRSWRARLGQRSESLDYSRRVNLKVTLRRFSAYDLVFLAFTVDGKRCPLLVDAPDRIAALFDEGATEAILECGYDADLDKCIPLQVATGPVDSWSALYPPQKPESMEEAEDVELDGQLEAQRSSDGPVMTIVDGQPTLSFTAPPVAPTAPRPPVQRPTRPPSGSLKRQLSGSTEPERERSDSTEPLAPPAAPAAPPSQPAYPAAVPPQREVLREVETPQVKPAPQYIPLQERELSADRATQSAAQQRIQERLAKGKRFEFRTKESENEAENTDAHEQGRARVARKPLVLRSKTELENTQWADPSA